MQRAHAIANGVYVASPNRVGHEDEPGTDGITFFGHSFIADPFGRYVAEAGEDEEILIATLRSGADRDGAPQLAVPARSPRRRVRSDPQPVSRLVTHGVRALRMPAEWEPHRATWISWPHHEPDWPASSAPIPWVYAEIVRVLAAHEPVEILCHSEEVLRRRARTRSTRTASAATASGCTSCRPIASGCATRRRPASLDATGDVVLRRLGVQRLGEVRQLAARRAGRRAPSPRITGLPRRRAACAPTPASASCSRAAASRSTATGSMLVTEEWLLSDVQVRNPGLTRDDYERDLPRVARHRPDDLARRRLRRRRHARPHRRHRALRQRRHRRARVRGGSRATRTTRARSTTCAGSSARIRRRPAAARRHAAVPAAGDDERRAAAGELRELLHRQRRRDRADVQRSERSRRAQHARRADARHATSSASTPSIWCGAWARCTA